jgi:hypothetical protein
MRLRHQLAAAASTLALVVSGGLIGAATPAAASTHYRDCNPNAGPLNLSNGVVSFFGGEVCGGVGILQNVTIALERNGALVPDSVVNIPSNEGLLALGLSTVPCVSGTYVGKVFASIIGSFGPDLDFGASQPVTITC